MSRNYLCIRSHLGLGDTIITAPIVREKAKAYELVCVLAKHSNVPSTEYLFRDCPNVVIRGVLDDQCADLFTNEIWKDQVLRLGASGPNFDGSRWDESFYLQAGVEFIHRWDRWVCPRDEQAEIDVMKASALLNPPTHHTFIHEDLSRGIEIKAEIMSEMAKRTIFVMPRKTITPILFHWRKVIEACDEIHTITSSFSVFIDSIDLPKNPKLFLHSYARPGEALPRYSKNWEVLT